MSFWVANILNGLSLAMVLFVLAAGLTLIFGMMQVTNLAHGSFYLLGAYIGLTVIDTTGSFFLGAAVAVVAVAAIGIVIERFLLRRLYRKELAQALFTLGLLFIFADLTFWIWGGNPQILPKPDALQGSIRMFGAFYPLYRLFLIGFGVLLAALLWVFIERTRLGAVVRAGMEDEEMLGGVGINTRLVFTAVFAAGAALAALGGVIGGPLIGAYPGADFDVLLLAFIVVTVGGIGSVAGAFLASLVIGLLDNFGTVWFPQFAPFTIIVPMIVVLAVRPTGLMGRT